MSVIPNVMHNPAMNMAPPPAYAAQQMPLPVFSGSQGGRTYELKVEQQPERARMCGFGDKDRRPITPPPCVRLIIRDQTTGREVGIDEVNSQFFVIHVDLWDEKGQREHNLVRHGSNSPSVSISMSQPTSYPPQAEAQYMLVPGGHQHPFPPYAMTGAYGDFPHNSPYYGHQVVPQPPPSAANYCKNLIGSLATSALVMEDLNKKTGFWFVLQDLSVRTEGTFRLKMSFTNLGNENGTLNRESGQILAAVFSEPFTVHSAKKFPGVKESTALSKCFAAQGVKLPIRKAENAKGGDDDQDD